MMLRAFIALEMPAEIQDAIAQSTVSLKNALPGKLVRWVNPRNIHLTIKFLGDISPTKLEQLAEKLKVEAALHTAFSMTARGLGAFPNPRRARVVWIGLEAPPALETIRRGVEKTAAQLGYPPEGRPFSPHLTIGRVGRDVSAVDLQHIHTALKGTKVGLLGTLQVDAVHIYKSDLQPGGAVYTRLYALSMKTI
jgi:2'-5' RNA ligase